MKYREVLAHLEGQQAEDFETICEFYYFACHKADTQGVNIQSSVFIQAVCLVQALLFELNVEKVDLLAEFVAREELQDLAADEIARCDKIAVEAGAKHLGKALEVIKQACPEFA